MVYHSLANIMGFYGIFLICCGIAALIFIGKKAKTALISGGTSGVISLLIAFFAYMGKPAAIYAGILVPLALFCVFSWRSTKTLFAVFDMVPSKDPALKGKGIAFLIISLMAVISLVVVLLQVSRLMLFVQDVH